MIQGSSHHNPDRPHPDAQPVLMFQLCEWYIEHCRARYTKYGRTTRSLATLENVLKLLQHHLGPDVLLAEFGPRRLEGFRRWMALHPSQRWARRTILGYTRIVVGMIRWAVAMEMTSPGHVASLRALEPLRRGRSIVPGAKPLREARRVRGVSEEVLEELLANCRPMLADMIKLQSLTGMRPCEVVAIRGCDLRMAGAELEYVVAPEVNKMDHEDRERIVQIGPQGVEILRRWAVADLEEYIFNPKRAAAAWLEERRRARKLPMWDSHTPAARRKRRRAAGARARQDGDRYTTDSYRRAIERACDRAGIPRIAPNRIRHTSATRICSNSSLEVARVLLGHADVKTTLRYVDPSRQEAAAVMRAIG